MATRRERYEVAPANYRAREGLPTTELRLGSFKCRITPVARELFVYEKTYRASPKSRGEKVFGGPPDIIFCGKLGTKVARNLNK